MRRGHLLRFAGLACVIACGGLAAGAEDNPCAGRGAGVLVVAGRHELLLCDGARLDGKYAIALGRGGVGKRRAGDKKTPMGTYPLGAPRPSTQFGTFIPIGYPTPAQRHGGYSGADVGVHGPKQSARWLGRASAWVDWTRGCIAVASNDDIAAIAAWVRRHPDAAITIE